ncbi:endomucin isoform X2 [Onychomys torridus]|uniref:endomucin isoform X2 n=1 Tax=Onychomys torridus TaxID=38674 RepID=UPI00167F5A44|nr:endomucin isoform X2 [Onychomys torridus]
MRLLQVTALFFLVSSHLCHSEDSKDVQNKSTPSLPEYSTTKSSVTTPGTVAVTNLSNLTVGTPAKGTAKGEISKTTLVPAFNLQTPVKGEEPITPSVIKNEVTTTNTTVPNPPVSDAVSTLPSSQHKISTQLPDALPKTTVLPSASLTTAKTISQLQDTEDGKITATPSTTPSYSSIILPVVIALIVITLLVFTLVGLYRMCWKRDPGTPENGNDQPQSDKESVKLLTVKTISHESGEHSAQGKTKN